MDEFYGSPSEPGPSSSNGWDTPLAQLPPFEEKCNLGICGSEGGHDPLYFKTDPSESFDELFTKFENEMMKDLHAYTYDERNTAAPYPADDGLMMGLGIRTHEFGNKPGLQLRDAWADPYDELESLCPMINTQGTTVAALVGEMQSSQEFMLSVTMNPQVDIMQLCAHVSWSLEHPEEER
jgi:hypothetical protein